MRNTLALVILCVVAALSLGAMQRTPLSEADIVDIALILKLEDTRQFDEAELTRLLASKHPEVKRRAVVAVGRIVNPGGSALLLPLRKDPSAEIVASVAFAAGQLKDATAVAWLGQVLSTATTPPAVQFEAARALGKIRTPEARAALAKYLTTATGSSVTSAVVGEALLSMGRFTTREDIAPIVKWTTATDAEVRWKAAWALFRPRNPAAVATLLKLTEDSSPEVRFWAARGLAPLPAVTPAPGAEPEKPIGPEPAVKSARLRALLRDSDRRVRTESLRALTPYDDDASFAAVMTALDDPDSWISVSAAETIGRHSARADAVGPKLTAIIADETKPSALRTVAQQQLTRLNAPPPDPNAPRGGGARSTGSGQAGRGGGARSAGSGQAGQAAQPAALARTDADYRAIVERWIVPAYNGASKPRAIWMTPKGEIEIELHAADAPLGMEELVRLTESGAIVGPAFTRLVPNFVAQQATIPGANRLRDEVSRLGLTRGNLAWASSGLDTGRPGYTLGTTPQPHNEGDFTALGRVVRGMDVVDRLELGDAITAARLVR
jgi:HEAT repeat protein/cyclophilin family peptidyl-prolyl cis-trans isomerase